MKSGYENSINSAVRRRDTILASSATAASTGAEETGPEPSTDATATATTTTSHTTVDAAATDASADAAPLSSSQKVAQAVLSGQSADNALSPDMARLSAAVSRGAGVPGNPLVVTLSERSCLISCLVHAR